MARHVVLRGSICTEFQILVSASRDPVSAAQEFLQRLYVSRDPNFVREHQGGVLTIRRAGDFGSDQWPESRRHS